MSSTITFSYLYISLLVIMAVAAVGTVVLLKVLRGRQAARGDIDQTLETGAPVEAMSRGHAESMIRRYLIGAGSVLTILALVTFAVIAGQPD